VVRVAHHAYHVPRLDLRAFVREACVSTTRACATARVAGNDCHDVSSSTTSRWCASAGGKAGAGTLHAEREAIGEVLGEPRRDDRTLRGGDVVRDPLERGALRRAALVDLEQEVGGPRVGIPRLTDGAGV
jgi:hypothetical protein